LPASGMTINGDLQRSTSRPACMFERRRLMGLTWLAARSSREGWVFVGRAPRKGQHGERGKRGGYRLRTGWRSWRAGIGRSRVVLARRSRCCRSRQAASDREKRVLATSPDLGSVRGRRSSPQPASERHKRSAATACEMDVEGRIEAETHHVTALRDRLRFARERGRHPSMEVTPGCIGWSSLQRRVLPGGLGGPTELACVKAQPREVGRRQGCQRFGLLGSARKKYAVHQPGWPTEAGQAS